MIDKFNTNKTAELTIEGKKYSLPIIEGTEGEKAIDIRCLRQESGYITLDSGYMNTGSCASEITFLDGAKKCAGLMPGATFVSFPGLDHGGMLARSDLALPHIKTFLAETNHK